MIMEISQWLEFLARGLVVLALAWMIACVTKVTGHGHRYWSGVFLLLLFMTIAGLGPAWQFIDLGLGSVDDLTLPMIDSVKMMAEPLASAPLSMAPQTPDLDAASSTLPVHQWLWRLWLVGVGVGLLRLIISRLHLSLIIHRSTDSNTDGVKVLESHSVTTPLSFGLLRPRIVVPAGFAEWPESERLMALLHEQRHGTRRDGIWQGLASLMLVLHWPNPLAWMARRRLEQDCELAVDADVLDSGVCPVAYSELLIRLASGAEAPIAAVAMARKSSVPLRVEKILSAGISGKVALGALLWLALGFLGGVALMLGVTSTRSQRERVADQPPVVSHASDFFTNIYNVSPTFGPQPIGDPFDPQTPQTPRPPIKEWMEECGISFPEGTYAIYNPSKSQLIVRNTADNMELVEALVDSLRQEAGHAQAQVYLMTKIFDAPRRVVEDYWLSPVDKGDLAGVFTSAQSQIILRELRQERDVDVIVGPSKKVRSGQVATFKMLPDRQIEIEVVIGADGYSIALELDYFGEKIQVTIWDGQTIALVEPLEENRIRTIFVTARLRYPAGKPVNQDWTDQVPPRQSISDP